MYYLWNHLGMRKMTVSTPYMCPGAFFHISLSIIFLAYSPYLVPVFPKYDHLRVA